MSGLRKDSSSLGCAVGTPSICPAAFAFGLAVQFRSRNENPQHRKESSLKEVSATGGARIGWVNATWPFAKFAASAMRLRLTSVLDTYDFLPIDVVSLERYGSIPFFYSGIRIVHARPDYPAKIIFWCFGNPEALIGEIHETGFLPTAPANSETKWRGVPVRWTTILFLILIWNGLFLLDDAVSRSLMDRPGLST